VLGSTINPSVMKKCFWLFDNEAKEIILTDDNDKLTIVDNGIQVSIYPNNIFKYNLKLKMSNSHRKVGFETCFNGLLKLIDHPKVSLIEISPLAIRLGNRSNRGNSTLINLIVVS
jgi:hypothetical protein